MDVRSLVVGNSRDASLATVAGTLRGRSAPPPGEGPRPAEGGAASESRRGEGLITLGGQSGTAIASGRELLARGERDDSS